MKRQYKTLMTHKVIINEFTEFIITYMYLYLTFQLTKIFKKSRNNINTQLIGSVIVE